MNQFGHGGEKAVSSRLSAQSRCTRCGERWKQSKLGLCRRCEQQLGIEPEGQLERERDRIAQQQLKARRAEDGYTPDQRARVALQARAPRPITIHPALGWPDHDYFVVWDGSMDGAPAMGLPLAHEKKSSRRSDVFD